MKKTFKQPEPGDEVEIKYNGKSEVVTLSETDGAGHTQGILSLPDVEPGQKVQVIVTASAPGGAIIALGGMRA